MLVPVVVCACSELREMLRRCWRKFREYMRRRCWCQCGCIPMLTMNCRVSEASMLVPVWCVCVCVAKQGSVCVCMRYVHYLLMVCGSIAC